MAKRMMPMRAKLSLPTTSTTSDGGAGGGSHSWELRSSGMLVQKRVDADDEDRRPPPTIRVRVKFGSVYHDIYINSQATFGELKKKLRETTGVHHEDQRIYYKGKERDSEMYLDIIGVKDKSKMVLEEDPLSKDKRFLEIRNNAKMEKAAKSVSQITSEVDRLAFQVIALESLINKGGRVAEKEVINLIELLMNELIKLDGIITSNGDVKLQRKMQVRRVQKHVETLDALKLKNSMPSTPKNTTQDHKATSNAPKPPRVPHSMGHSPLKPRAQDTQPLLRDSSSSSAAATVVTTQWETFDSTPLPPPHSVVSDSIAPKFPWDNVFA